jgi:beta-N-acetylhexosaminidase
VGNGTDYEDQARSIVEGLNLEQRCGQLLVVGFDGTDLPAALSEAIHAGRRGGVILFKRNLPDIESAWGLCRCIRETYPTALPPMIALDEEGGRVSRLPEPFKRLPPMRHFGARDDLGYSAGAGKWLGLLLAFMGVNCNFAPVLDVDTNGKNPVIGDRSFSKDPSVVTRHALAFIRGMQEQGVAACGKHFPGHGDTALDSHLELPCVDLPLARLERVELAPFRECARSSLAAVMTAHVTYPALDPTLVPATFSRPILDGLLRKRLGFGGVIFSDDLEMGAIAKLETIEAAACLAVRAGCDALLICRGAATAERALMALAHAASQDEILERRIVQAAQRIIALRLQFRPAKHPIGELLDAMSRG